MIAAVKSIYFYTNILGFLFVVYLHSTSSNFWNYQNLEFLDDSVLTFGVICIQRTADVRGRGNINRERKYFREACNRGRYIRKGEMFGVIFSLPNK